MTDERQSGAGRIVRHRAGGDDRPSPTTCCPPATAYAWTGTAYQEQQASGQTGFVLALAVLFAYLFLVALYESTDDPDPGACCRSSVGGARLYMRAS